MKKKSPLILSEFILKIIGFITMTFDHLGVFLQMTSKCPDFAYACRCIGRLAFPLFVFMIIEGVRHTKNFGKYILRLGILASILIVGEFGIYLIDNEFNFASPVTDLFFIALAIYLIKRKDKFSFLSILPIGYILGCFAVTLVEFYTNYNVEFLPSFIRCDYQLFGLLLALGYYFSSDLAKAFLKSKKETENLVETPFFQECKNIMCALTIMLVATIYYLCTKYTSLKVYETYVIYAMFSSVPILLYSGKRGYNAKWFQYGSYVYFPLHLIILFAIFFFAGLITI